MESPECLELQAVQGNLWQRLPSHRQAAEAAVITSAMPHSECQFRFIPSIFIGVQHYAQTPLVVEFESLHQLTTASTTLSI
jgi:hypothetical protein